MSREFLIPSGLVGTVPDERSFVLSGVYLAGEPLPTMARVSPINMTSATTPAPYVVTSKSFYDASFADWKAFDGNPATSCASNSRTPPPWWIKIDLGTMKCVSEYVYQTRGDFAGNAWRAWTLEGSNDDVHWMIVDRRVGEMFGAAGELREYVCPTPRTFRYWKWNVTDTPTDYADVGSLELWGPVLDWPPPMVLVSPDNMTSNTTPSPYVVTSSNELAGYFGFNAFDSNEASLTHSNDPLTQTPYWIKIDLSVSQNVVSYKYQARNVGPYHCWKTWTLEGSNDDTAWTLVDTVFNEPAFAVSEIRWYDCDAPDKFRYWRWSVTSTSGVSGTYAEAATLELWGYLEEDTGSSRVKVWSGTAWLSKPVKVWTSTFWAEKPVKVWNGSAWV